MIPVERGANWSLTECFEGNPNKNREPVTAFINSIAEHDNGRLKSTMLFLEGIICGRGIHASSTYLYNDGFIKQNSLMKAPNGTDITAFNMSDSDYMGGLKMDLLTIKALDKLQAAIQILIEEGLIEDQGSLKATYDKYLHPDVLNYDDPEMWAMLGRNEIIDLFQFDTLQGKQAALKIKPCSLLEMASANSLMRLIPPDGEDAPMDVYVRHKANPEVWYQEMRDHGLSEHDIAIMRKHLDSVYGVASAQEEIMLLAMDEEIAGFTMTEANKLRKGIAKKKPKVLAEIKELFFKKCEERGTSNALASYVWDVQFKRQENYSFSLNHTLPYSTIGLQEMNFVRRYGSIFWNTACLTINAGADTDNDNNDVTDYGKIGTAIGNIQKQGQQIALPSVNRARFDFRPDTERNEIVFALKAIRGIGDEQANTIIRNQPYASFEDFLEKTQDVVKPAAVIALIKSGAFDELENDRRSLMKRFLRERDIPSLSKLTLKNTKELIECGAIQAGDYKAERIFYNYVQYVKSTEPVIKGSTSGKTWYYVKGPTDSEDYFNRNVLDLLKPGRDYKTHEDGYQIITGSALARALKLGTATFKQEVLDNPVMLDKLNDARTMVAMRTKCPGSLSAWEFETMTFYHGPHELVNAKQHGFKDFFQLPYTPVSIPVTHGNRTYETTAMCEIAGTVIDRNTNKHIVTLLTTDGVVKVKFYRENFSLYNQQLSEIDEHGTKTVLEKSWFSRGNKLIIHGFRREDMFIARPDKKKHIPSVTLITNVNEQTGEIEVNRYRGGVTV